MKEKEIRQYDSKELWENLNKSQTNKERIEKTAKMIPEDVKSIADIGCGNGIFLGYLSKHSSIKELVGVDFSEKAMEGLEGKKMVGDITKIPLGNNSYDLTSALEVLEHLDIKEYEVAKEELARVSKKYILISVPFDEDLKKEFLECPKCLSEFNMSHHKRSFEEKTVRELFIKQNYICSDIQYVSKRNIYFLLTPIQSMLRKRSRRYFRKNIVCPVCGYQETCSDGSKDHQKSSSKGKFLKKLWPKRYKYKWIVALYQKKG